MALAMMAASPIGRSELKRMIEHEVGKLTHSIIAPEITKQMNGAGEHAVGQLKSQLIDPMDVKLTQVNPDEDRPRVCQGEGRQLC